MGALQALQIFDDILGELGMKLQSLAALVVGVDRESFLHGRHRLQVSPLVKFHSRIEVEGRGRFEIVTQRRRGQLLSLGDAPSVQELYAALKWGVGFRGEPTLRRGEKDQIG